MLIRTLNIKVSFQWTFEDSLRWLRWIVSERLFQARMLQWRRRGCPLLYATSPAQWDRLMTQSAGDAVILYSRQGRWRSADSSVWTLERTGKPECTLYILYIVQLVLDALRYTQPMEVRKERVAALMTDCRQTRSQLGRPARVTLL